MSSVFGKNIQLSIFGQSHSEAIGMTLDGIPAGIRIDFQQLAAFLARRAPGNSAFATARRESDEPEFLCGLINGVTCGAPITAIIRNANTRPGDYQNLSDVPRPGHADYTAHVKHNGFQDPTGGGHFSGRLTAPLCIAGGICLQLLRDEGIRIGAHIRKLGACEDVPFDPCRVSEEDFRKIFGKVLPVIDSAAEAEMERMILEQKMAGDSIGGVIECAIIGLPAGIGDPMFDGLENKISGCIFAIPAVKGIEFGSGFAGSSRKGSENNDAFYIENGAIRTKTNRHGGILGGISSGMPVLFNVAVKPTPSIGLEQDSVRLSALENTKLIVKGRHDPCILPRAVPCVEAAAAIAVYDILRNTK
ncbi:MAG: chorismate synthase [Clostridia bacterium]